MKVCGPVSGVFDECAVGSRCPLNGLYRDTTQVSVLGDRSRRTKYVFYFFVTVCFPFEGLAPWSLG